MPVITEADLKKQIEKCDFSNLYFLYGEEKYLVNHYADRLIAKAGDKKFATFNVQVFDGAESDADRVAAAVEALPFMAERKCVAVSDPDFSALRAGEAEKWKELLSGIPETTVLVLWFPTREMDIRKEKGWKKFFDLAVKTGNVVEFKRKTGVQLERLLCSGAQKRGCELDRADAAHILELCGPDLTNLLNELEKLCSFVHSGKISREVIDRLVVKNLEARVFDLSKAILSGAYDRAYRLLDLLFYQNEEPVSVLAVLSSAYLDLYRVKVCVQSGLSAKEPAKYFDYARKEFRLTNAERDGKRFSKEMLRDSLRTLLAADTALKSARGDRRLVMEKLIAQLLLISEKGRAA